MPSVLTGHNLQLCNMHCPSVTTHNSTVYVACLLRLTQQVAAQALAPSAAQCPGPACRCCWLSGCRARLWSRCWLPSLASSRPATPARPCPRPPPQQTSNSHQVFSPRSYGCSAACRYDGKSTHSGRHVACKLQLAACGMADVMQ